MSRKASLEPTKAAQADDTIREGVDVFFVLVEVAGLTDELYPDNAGHPVWLATVAARLLEVLDTEAVTAALVQSGKGCIVLGIEPRHTPDDYAIRSFTGVSDNLKLLIAAALDNGRWRASASLLSAPDDKKSRQLAATVLMLEDRDRAIAFCDAVRRGRRRLAGKKEEDDYSIVFEEAKRTLHSAKQEIIAALTPALNAALAAMPHESYIDKQETASWVNGQLREVGLAVKCPKTGRPGILVADVKGGESEVSRFRLEIRDKSGRRTRTWSSQGVPTLELMQDAAREEPLAKWAKHIREKKQDENQR
jgi:hypothetical protein